MRLALTAALLCAAPNAYACSVTVPVGDETIEVRRDVDAYDGKFNFTFHTSIAAKNMNMQYYWTHAPGSLRAVVPVPSIDFKAQGFTKLKNGTFLLLVADDGREWKIPAIIYFT